MSPGCNVTSVSVSLGMLMFPATKNENNYLEDCNMFRWVFSYAYIPQPFGSPHNQHRLTVGGFVRAHCCCYLFGIAHSGGLLCQQHHDATKPPQKLTVCIELSCPCI